MLIMVLNRVLRTDQQNTYSITLNTQNLPLNLRLRNTCLVSGTNKQIFALANRINFFFLGKPIINLENFIFQT